MLATNWMHVGQLGEQITLRHKSPDGRHECNVRRWSDAMSRLTLLAIHGLILACSPEE